MFSYIQELILTGLITTKGLKYSELRPEDVDDDLYNYHLQQLVEKGYVEKTPTKKYRLTKKGKEQVQKYDALGNQKDYFKFSVIGHTVNNNGEILLQKRTRHPYFGDIYAGISGKVLWGEDVEDAAKRKVKEETDLECEFKFLGVLRKTRRTQEGKVFEDTLYHICYGENPTGDLAEKNDFGEHFWGSFDDAIKFQKNNITAGPYSEEILKRIKNKDFSTFYFHEEIELPKGY